MSTTFGTINPAQPAWTQRALALFNRYRDAFLGWRRRMRLQARLSDLNDRELHDIGLARGDNFFGLFGIGDEADGPRGNSSFGANRFRERNLKARTSGNFCAGDCAST